MDSTLDWNVDVWSDDQEGFASMDRAELAQLIKSQLPSYRKRPHIENEDTLLEDLPHVLEMMRNNDDDYAWSLCYRPRFYLRMVWEGFLPICCCKGERLYVLLPKLHEVRCVMDSTTLEHLHIEKNARRRARRFRMTRGHAFSEVIAGCIEQHGESWLHPPMQALLQACQSLPQLPPPLSAVKITSWEVWEEGQLAAGELGAIVGRRYMSLTGFSRVSGAGTVQLLATGRILHRQGALLWDLGQEMPYKTQLGASGMARDEFLKLNEELRGDSKAPHEMQLPDVVEDLHSLLS